MDQPILNREMKMELSTTWHAAKTMQFRQFQKLFLAAHPAGEALRFPDGQIAVRFAPDARLYYYRNYGIRALAERLKIV